MVKETIVILLVIGIVAGSYVAGTYFISKLKPQFDRFDLTQKPSKFKDSIIINPDFIYPTSFSRIDENLTTYLSGQWNVTKEWEGQIKYFHGTIYFGKEGRSGIFVLHPNKDPKKPRFVQQILDMPENKKYKLKIGLADINGNYSKCNCELDNDFAIIIGVKCADVGFKIKIIDNTTKKEDLIADFIVNSEEGWKDVSYDLSSKYSGHKITVRVESYAGGPCGNWNGEWAALDYIYLEER
jgi:hypothetical protein